MKQLLLFCGGAFFLFAVGCGATNTEPPLTVQVSGKVTYSDGRPVNSGVVVFHAKDKPGNDALALVGADGTFKLGTFAKDDGAIPGRYVVTFDPNPKKVKNGPSLSQSLKKYGDEDNSPWQVTVSESDGQILALTLR